MTTPGQQIPGVAPPPIMTSDQILNHLDSTLKSLPQPVQAALDHAHTLTGGSPASGLDSVAKPSASSAPDVAPPPVSSWDSGLPGMVGVSSRDMDANRPEMPLPARGIESPVMDARMAPKMAPVPSDNQRELARITAPPLPSSDPNAHTKLDTGRTGIGQIHNPFLRGLATAGDVIASGVFPRFGQFIPGTTGYHNNLVANAANAVARENEQRKEDEAAAEQEARTEAIPAETELKNAQAKLANTQADTLAAEGKQKPKDEYITVPGGGLFNAKTREWERQPADKSQLYELDPEVGKALKVKPDADGKYYVPIQGANELLKPKPPEKQDDKEKFVQQYLTENKLEDNATNRGRALHEYATVSQAPQRPPVVNVEREGVTYVDPSTHKLIRLNPGDTVPEGAITPQQLGSQNAPTTQMRNVAAQARLVHEQTPEMLAQIDKLKDKLGPVSGRWNEFMQGKVGMEDPEMAGLRADLLMYSSAVALMHARGRLPENLREEFDHAINAPKQSPENLKAVINRIDRWTSQNAGVMGQTQNPQHGTTSAVDPKVKAYADKYFGGDTEKAQAEIDKQKQKK